MIEVTRGLARHKEQSGQDISAIEAVQTTLVALQIRPPHVGVVEAVRIPSKMSSISATSLLTAS